MIRALGVGGHNAVRDLFPPSQPAGATLRRRRRRAFPIRWRIPSSLSKLNLIVLGIQFLFSLDIFSLYV